MKNKRKHAQMLSPQIFIWTRKSNALGIFAVSISSPGISYGSGRLVTGRGGLPMELRRKAVGYWKTAIFSFEQPSMKVASGRRFLILKRPPELSNGTEWQRRHGKIGLLSVLMGQLELREQKQESKVNSENGKISESLACRSRKSVGEMASHYSGSKLFPGYSRGNWEYEIYIGRLICQQAEVQTKKSLWLKDVMANMKQSFGSPTIPHYVKTVEKGAWKLSFTKAAQRPGFFFKASLQ